VTADPRLDDLADAVATRVIRALELQLGELTARRPPGVLVDAATVAGELGVSRAYVYRHAAELGGHRIGSGPRPRLRFDVDEARAAWRALERSPVTAARAARATHRSGSSTGVPLLPVRGRRAA
jgi:hypothetical protein